ncbi:MULTISPECIES: Cof-type HAD-IIB family hydrolase [unclassified Bacillus (in: firmicutes)]|uniref:Cof-type HAD-IIB family hydrolase n=1 Tax=unclassified Bacillus (in: firmicutes) TaxID=185979 RepID=UPI0008E5054B|nr:MULTISPECIES: Cof-type HAD-IIB family hydrolase [unclassified Bacillus (in: firmicutes)]SFB16748.1 Cof subfamily of IIB subfamily of haloacid dehalogenase superfamily/HAD-superfamily hydrolase, subfamily IIB [Bacillus sp. UNCCL13]SFQ77869.1 Cof subfamily of IIB subfamily of haloacid dehalogenase superfamily/HAD-superfamily hydrolase, subfamily IIB [Bacillus sp. cl95]
MEYKIVFFDVDGTITHHEDGSISTKTKEAIKELKNKGIKVVAATGRPLSLCEEIRELGIDTFITANGGYAKHNQNVIHKVPMNQEIVKEVLEFAYNENHGLSFFTEEFSMNGVKDIEILKALKETLSLNDYPVIKEMIHQEEIYLMCLYANDETVEKYMDNFPYLTFQRWHPYVLNVLQEEISKSLAIIKVLQYFNIDKSEAIAFGDGENDIDMLELVGLGIAMGNGNEKLKKVADFVTKKSSEDGIEFALQHYGII